MYETVLQNNDAITKYETKIRQKEVQFNLEFVKKKGYFISYKYKNVY